MNLNRSKKYFLPGITFSFLLLLVSCKKDVPPVKPADNVTAGGSGFVYVLNEGNYMSSNASVTRLNLTDGAVVSDYYKTQNNNSSVGDVLQSVYLHNNKYYLVLNNSGKITVADKFSFGNVGTISGLTSPRYFLPVSNNKAFVTDLYANAVSVIDLVSNTKTGSIALGGWTEQLVLSYGNVFVTNMTSSYVYVINPATNALTDSVYVGYASGSIAEDKNGKLWVLCSGDASQNFPAMLTRLDPISKSVDTSFQFPSSVNSPFKMRMNGAKDELFYIDHDGVYKMNINGTLPLSPFIPEGNRIFYGLGIDPQDGTVYAADVIDYNQNGKIYRYNSNGNPIDNFSAGIIPGDFFFEK